MMKVYLHKLNMDKMLGEETELLGRLPAWRYEKSSAVKVEAERMRSIAAGMLLVKAIADVAGVSEDVVREAEWGTDASLRAYEKENSSADNKERIILALIGGEKFYFNLTHSGEYVAVVVGDNPAIGIDIETKEDKDYKITKRMFTEEEKAYILNGGMKCFRDIWTKKESFLKCTGEGISVPLNSFSFDLETGEVKTLGYNLNGKKYFTSTFTDEEFSLSVTVKTNNIFALDIERIKVLV